MTFERFITFLFRFTDLDISFIQVFNFLEKITSYIHFIKYKSD